MTLCWNKDENGKVIGMCGTEELKRRIHDPNYMPEHKALMKKLDDERSVKKWAKFAAIPPERKEEIRQEWVKHLERQK